MPNNIPLKNIIRKGDDNGDGWVIQLETDKGRAVYGIAVAQSSSGRTGPTWSYVFENDGFTVVDLGTPGSFDNFVDGYSQLPLNLNNIQRVIFTHGHSDHDGTAHEFSSLYKAEIWAHKTYSPLKKYKIWEIQDRESSVLQKELMRISSILISDSDKFSRWNQYSDYYANKSKTSISKDLSNQEMFKDLQVVETPGHSPDQIVLLLDNFMFTGDHILPEITPHPTSNTIIQKKISNSLPYFLKDTSPWFGLGTYLNSLSTTMKLGNKYSILPAHRLHNKGEFNWIDQSRGLEIISHHEKRLNRIIHRLNSNSDSLEDLTRGIFEKSKLLGANIFAAMSEIVAHLEFLEDCNDINVSNSGKITVTGNGINYIKKLEQLRSV